MKSEQNNKKDLRSKTVTFLSDFGLGEECVAVCKGVILSIAPEAKIIDISHMIPPYDVRKGAFVLAQAIKWIEANVHLAIVDPGVGGNRRAVILQTPKGFLVGPDNGLLIPASKALGGIEKAVEIKNRKYFLPDVSPTFHGRDIFSPVAGYLLNGVALNEFGIRINMDGLAPSPWDEPLINRGKAVLEVIDIDNFGSVRLNFFKKEHIRRFVIKKNDELSLSFDDELLALKLVDTYSAVKRGETALLFDSTDCLAVFINEGNAAKKFGLKTGSKITFTNYP